ncbi:MAG: zf-TFIIB domain-containing protein [Thermodesulfovibrionales bacterium]|nr:zf-TFIIB domain-containing protein [Thermodesulfovibrionales bacterium]
MDFPIVELMDREACVAWLMVHFHPNGMKCPHCQASLEQSILFRRTKRSDLDVRRCKACRGIYNLYSGTEFEGRQFTPEQTILFIREMVQGKPTAKLSSELNISRTTGLTVRHLLQKNAKTEQATEPLSDLEVETDEMLQNAGEKRRKTR